VNVDTNTENITLTDQRSEAEARRHCADRVSVAVLLAVLPPSASRILGIAPHRRDQDHAVSQWPECTVCRAALRSPRSSPCRVSSDRVRRSTGHRTSQHPSPGRNHRTARPMYTVRCTADFDVHSSTPGTDTPHRAHTIRDNVIRLGRAACASATQNQKDARDALLSISSCVVLNGTLRLSPPRAPWTRRVARLFTFTVHATCSLDTARVLHLHCAALGRGGAVRACRAGGGPA